MKSEEIEALPDNSLVVDADGYIWQKLEGLWYRTVSYPEPFVPGRDAENLPSVRSHWSPNV